MATVKKTSSKKSSTTKSKSDPCLPGYEQVGMKTKNGKLVPNCVPIKKAAKKKSAKKSAKKSPKKSSKKAAAK
jgi:hypothetical protein